MRHLEVFHIRFCHLILVHLQIKQDINNIKNYGKDLENDWRTFIKNFLIFLLFKIFIIDFMMRGTF